MTPEDALVEAVARAIESWTGYRNPDIARAAIAAARPAIEAEAYRRAAWEAQGRESEGGEYGMAARHIAAAIRALIPEVPS